MICLKQHTAHYLLLFSGMLCLLFLFLSVSDVLIQTGVLGKEKMIVIELCKKEKEKTTNEIPDKEFSEDGTDWLIQKNVAFYFGYRNTKHPLLGYTPPAITSMVNEVQLPPPKYPLI